MIPLLALSTFSHERQATSETAPPHQPLIPIEQLAVNASAKNTSLKVLLQVGWAAGEEKVLVNHLEFKNFEEAANAIKKQFAQFRGNQGVFDGVVAIHLDRNAKLDRYLRLIELFHYEVQPSIDIAFTTRPENGTDEVLALILECQRPSSVTDKNPPSPVRIHGANDWDIVERDEDGKFFVTKVNQKYFEDLQQEFGPLYEGMLALFYAIELRADITFEEFLTVLEPFVTEGRTKIRISAPEFRPHL